VIYVVCALAVYKFVQIVDALLPKEAMPWVKLIFGWWMSIAAVGLAGPHFGQVTFGWFILVSLAVATLAGTVHTVLRLLTLWGDRARATRR
jgi:hypothetical protein